ncbi:MAG: Nif3-like dinuclear metal center hexameric protein [Pseudomonadota bacterium]
MRREQLDDYLAQLLAPSAIKDYCPNGLQIEGSAHIAHIVTGVTASKALIEKAIELNADTVIVHHGYFWKNEDYRLIGMKKHRIALILEHNINLFAYHLPLDVHPVVGNNRQLGEMIGLNNIQPMENIHPEGIVMQGELTNALSHVQFRDMLARTFQRTVIGIDNEKSIQRVAWCTGGGQHFIDDVVLQDRSVDAFISGEISEQTTHSAREQDIDYFAIGHHASERYGAKALGEHLSSSCDVKVTFIDIDNPA